MRTRNTIDLDSDDDVDLLLDVEKTFDIKISDGQAVQIYSIGDLYDLIIKELPAKNGRKCMTSMSFYRLKEVFLKLNKNINFHPTANIEDLSDMSPKSLWNEINRKSGLQLPYLNNSIIGNIGFTLGFLSLCLVLLSFFLKLPLSIGFLSIIPLVLSICLVKADQMKFPNNIHTVADLAYAVSNLNYGKFVKTGARVTNNSHWIRLMSIIDDYSHTLEKEKFTRQTLFR